MIAPVRTASPGDSRAVAAEVLRAVLEDGRPLDDSLAKHRGLPRLAPRDRAFARMMTATTLRRLGQIDDLIAACMERPLRRGQGEARSLLRIGACQLALLRTPAHAAIDTTVSLAHTTRLEPYRALINAVLRRLSREMDTLIPKQDVPRLCTPAWLWHSWSLAYGEATARAMAAVHIEDPPLDLTAQEDPEAWAGRLGARLLPTGTLRLPSGAGEVGKLQGYKRGAWWVQDAAASLPARLLEAGPGQRIVDLCAAPGGKTAQLAASGAEVIAVDRSEQRLQLLTENLQRLGLAAATVAADARRWRPPEPVDAVLLDAPCSGTGTLRRHPDIAQLKTERDLSTLTVLQDKLLDAALAMLKPGGLLVYATCSLQPEEGARRIAALLERSAAEGSAPPKRVPIRPEEIAGLAEAVTKEGDLRTLPCFLAEDGGMDGFYACRLRRPG